MTSDVLLAAVFTALTGDATMTSLLAPAGADGVRRVRYARNLDLDASPVLAVDPALTVPGNAPRSRITTIGFTAWVRADATTVGDPMAVSVNIIKRVQTLFVLNPRSCNTPKGLLDSSNLPDQVTLPQGEFWQCNAVIRFNHSDD